MPTVADPVAELLRLGSAPAVLVELGRRLGLTGDELAELERLIGCGHDRMTASPLDHRT